MEKILSQEEVDALLMGVTGGEVETTLDLQEPQEGPVPYDLGNQEWIVRGRMPTLDVIHQQFARLYRVTLSEVLRKTVEVSVTNQSVMKFGEFTKRLPVPAYLMVVSLEPLRGFALVATDAATVYLLVDHFLGGKGQTHVKPEGQDFTLIEQHLMKKVLRMGLADLQKAWEPVQKISVKIVRTEINPQLAAIVLPADIVIVITIGIELGDAVGDLHLCVPYAMLEPIRDRLQVSFQSDFYEVDPSWIRRFSARLQETTVTMTVHLGNSTISVVDLLNFSIGDVIVLDQSTNEPLTATVQKVPKFLGFPGMTKAAQSFQIGSIIMPKE